MLNVGDKAPKHYASVHIVHAYADDISTLQSALSVMLAQIKDWPVGKPYDMSLTRGPTVMNLEISSRD